MYILYVTKTRIKRYLIAKAEGYKPCNCVYEKHSEYQDLITAIEAKEKLEKEQES